MGAMEPDRLTEDARLAVLKQMVEDDRTEIRGLRERLHALAGQVAALMHLGRQVEDLTRSVDGLKEDLPKIVRDNSRQVAEDVMEQGMEKRDELERKRWGLRIQWMSLGFMACGLILGVIYHFTS